MAVVKRLFWNANGRIFVSVGACCTSPPLPSPNPIPSLSQKSGEGRENAWKFGHFPFSQNWEKGQGMRAVEWVCKLLCSNAIIEISARLRYNCTAEGTDGEVGGILGVYLSMQVIGRIDNMANNFSEKANFIWTVADDTLRVYGAFKAHEYREVFFPFATIRPLNQTGN
jgi:hypothetical protein